MKRLLCIIFGHRILWADSFGQSCHVYRCDRCLKRWWGQEDHDDLLPWDARIDMIYHRERILRAPDFGGTGDATI